MTWTDDRIMRAYRVGLIGLALLLLCVLAWRDTAPTGRLRIGHGFAEPSPFVSEVVPVQRTARIEQGTVVSAEPVYMTVRYPRPFQRMQASLVFENPNNLAIEIGAQTQAAEIYDLQGINHPGLNTLDASNAWGKLPPQNGVTLWQRNRALPDYESLSAVWNNPPDQERTAYYGTTWFVPYLPDFARSQQPSQQKIPVPLRGAHAFYLATDQDSVSFSADVFDLNRRIGPDDVHVQLLSWDGTVLAEQKLADDGNAADDGRLGSRQVLNLFHAGLLEAGVYQLVIHATDDIIMRDATVQAPYLVAKGWLAIAGGPEYRAAFGENVGGPIHLVTSSRTIVASTNHIDSLQSIHIGQESLVLQEPFESHEYVMPDTSRFLLNKGYELSLEQGNVRLSGRGVFAVSASGYFSPVPWYFDSTIDADVLELAHVIASYQPPQDLGDGVFRQQFTIDLASAFAPEKAVRLQLAVPDLEKGQSLTLLRLETDFLSEPVTLANFSQKLSNFIRREILK